MRQAGSVWLAGGVSVRGSVTLLVTVEVGRRSTLHVGRGCFERICMEVKHADVPREALDVSPRAIFR